MNESRAEIKMREYDLDALIATSSANVFYTSDLCSKRSFVLLPFEKDVEPAIITPISAPTPIVVMSPSHISDVRYYGEFYTTMPQNEIALTESEQNLAKAQESWDETKKVDSIEILIGLLEERGILEGKIGIDESSLRQYSSPWQRIERRLHKLEIVPAEKIFREIRMVKSSEEIRRIREAVRISEKAWETALEHVSVGMTEREFAKVFEHTIISEGGRTVSWMGMYGPPVAFGRRTAFVDIALPSDYRLRTGDILRFDGGCSYMGYPCDMARSAVLGQPDSRIQKYWDALFEGEKLAIDTIKPGIKASEIFNSTVERVRENGIPHYKRHNTGHGWGIERYDPPLIGPNDHTPLEEGMVLCIETPYYEVGWGGLLHEDVIVVTEGGSQYLTTYEGELRIIEK
jgi:Xaa-Pro aminopeptidase